MPKGLPKKICYVLFSFCPNILALKKLIQIEINYLTCPVGRISLLLRQDEPGESHAVGVHRLHGSHGDAV